MIKDDATAGHSVFGKSGSMEVVVEATTTLLERMPAIRRSSSWFVGGPILLVSVSVSPDSM